VAPLDDGGLGVTVRTADLAWARRLVASLGGEARVEEPAALGAEIAADARAALQRYGLTPQTPAG
jgi:proteasome accessory factor C